MRKPAQAPRRVRAARPIAIDELGVPIGGPREVAAHFLTREQVSNAARVIVLAAQHGKHTAILDVLRHVLNETRAAR